MRYPHCPSSGNGDFLYHQDAKEQEKRVKKEKHQEIFGSKEKKS